MIPLANRRPSQGETDAGPGHEARRRGARPRRARRLPLRSAGRKVRVEANDGRPVQSGGRAGAGCTTACTTGCCTGRRTGTHRPALFLMSLAEASFFPIPPDVLLMAMSVGEGHEAPDALRGTICVGRGLDRRRDDRLRRSAGDSGEAGRRIVLPLGARVSARRSTLGSRRSTTWTASGSSSRPASLRSRTRSSRSPAAWLQDQLRRCSWSPRRSPAAPGSSWWPGCCATSSGPRVPPIEKYLGWLTIAFVVLCSEGSGRCQLLGPTRLAGGRRRVAQVVTALGTIRAF